MADATPYPLPRGIRETEVLTGDGGDTYGPFTFRIFDVADVEVWVCDDGEEEFERRAVAVQKVSGAAYDLFTVAFPGAVPATSRFIVRSARVAERAAGVLSGSRIDPDALEKEYSKIAAVLQELRRDVDRAIAPVVGAERQALPAAMDGWFLGWAGERLANIREIDPEALAASSFGAALLAVADAGAARTLLELAYASWDEAVAGLRADRVISPAMLAGVLEDFDATSLAGRIWAVEPTADTIVSRDGSGAIAAGGMSVHATAVSHIRRYQDGVLRADAAYDPADGSLSWTLYDAAGAVVRAVRWRQDGLMAVDGRLEVTGTISAGGRRVAEVATNTQPNDTDFPVGHTITILCRELLPRNSVVVPCLNVNNNYEYFASTVSGAGSPLAGVWRVAGVVPGSNPYYHVRRVQ